MMSPTPVSVGAATWLSTIPLSAEDEATINDLRVAYRNSLIVNVEKVVSSRDKANLTDLVNIAELSVRRVIAMVKQVSCGQAHLLSSLKLQFSETKRRAPIYSRAVRGSCQRYHPETVKGNCRLQLPEEAERDEEGF